jgi:transposase
MSGAAPDPLPEDAAGLRALVLVERAARAEAEVELEKLRRIIAELQRHRFGRRAEALDAEQLALAIEETEQALAAAEAATPAAPEARPEPLRRRRVNRGRLPADLPREEIVVDLADKTCPCCGGGLHPIGEDVSERLDIVPARLRVLVIRRPKYACRGCESGVAQAAAPARLVEAGLPTETLVAHVLTAKYADHLPLYRQAQMFERQGVALDRATLADWVGRAAFLLRPLRDRLLERLKASGHLFADETAAPVLDPGRGRCKTGRLWAYARDDRPWRGPEPPGVAYRYAPDRKGANAEAHLAGFKGVLQVDGYAGYNGLAGPDGATLAFCWAHVRRRFYEIHHATGEPAAAEALRRIAALYRLEDGFRGRAAAERRRLRQMHAAPLVAALRLWLEAEQGRISPKSALAGAIRYGLARWDGLVRYLDDGRIELDSNTVERAIRPLALGRKNHLFAGSDAGGEHWAVIASLVATCKLNGVDPETYLASVLTRLVNGHLMSRIDELLPWTYATPKATADAA